MTSTPDQVIANIREALEGVSKGNWRRDETEDTAETLVVQGARDVICRVPWNRDTTGSAHRDANYIAAVNPRNIAVLLAEREELRAALQKAADLAEAKAEELMDRWTSDLGATVETKAAGVASYLINELYADITSLQIKFERPARTLAGDNHE